MPLMLSILLTAAVYGLAFDYRSDYLGHFIAGFGGTLLLFALEAGRRRRIRWNAVWIALLAIALGVLTEATIFRIAIFDPVDLFNQSLGAVLAGAGVLNHLVTPRTPRFFALLGFITVAAGFYFAFT